MARDEKLLITLLFVALTALIIWRITPRQVKDAAATVLGPVDVATQPDNDGRAGPAYLVYNQPWGFVPPVSNFTMPSRAIGQIGMNEDWNSGEYWANSYR